MTVGAYSSRAARFLARYAPDGDPAVIAPGDVTAAVLADASGLSAGAGQHLACALRAFLRYCHVRGLVSADVSAAALSVTGRRTTMLPRGRNPARSRRCWPPATGPSRTAGGLRGHRAAGPARPAGRGSRPAPPGRHSLAGRRDRDPRQGRPVRRPPAPGRCRRRDRRLAARRPPGRLLPGGVHHGDRADPAADQGGGGEHRPAGLRPGGNARVRRAPAAALRGLRHDRREGPDGLDRAGHAAPVPRRDRDLRPRRDRPAASPRPSLARDAGPARRGKRHDDPSARAGGGVPAAAPGTRLPAAA